MDSKVEIAEIGWKLVDLPQRDRRASYANLGRKVGLSPPAVADRIRQVEDLGIVTGYRARVDRARSLSEYSDR